MSDSILQNNLNVLFNITKNDKLNVDLNHNLVVYNEDFDEINTNNLELEIINTLLFEILRSKNNYKSLNESLKKIDIILDNIYENFFLNTCIDNSDFFNKSLSKVNDKYFLLREKYQKNRCNITFLKINDLFNNFLKDSVLICQMIHKTNMMIHGEIDSADDTSEDESSSDKEDSDDTTDDEDYLPPLRM